MKDLLMKYGITLGRRNKKSEKLLFLSELTKDVKAAGCQVQVVSGSVLLQKYVHVIVNDIEKAKAVIIVNYDTPTKSIGHPLYYPIQQENNRKILRNQLILQALVFALLCLCIAGYALLKLPYTMVISVIALLASLLLLYYIGNRSNRLNHNRNSAALVAAMELACTRKELAVVFTDQMAASQLGLNTLVKQVPQLQSRLIVMMECIAHGETLAVVCSEKSRVCADALAERLSSYTPVVREYDEEKRRKTRLHMFQNALIICSGELQSRQFVVKNTQTNLDYRIDMERLISIKEALAGVLS